MRPCPRRLPCHAPSDRARRLTCAAVSTIVITGSAGGIGVRGQRARLERDGHRVIGVDVRDAEVIADLATAEGRATMVAATLDACDGVCDGLVAGAGTMDKDARDPGELLRQDHDAGGAPARPRRGEPTARGSRSARTRPRRRPACRRASSQPASTTTRIRARELARSGYAYGYAGSKLALARWVRRHAVTDTYRSARASP